MRISLIGCPQDWAHPLDPSNYVCLQCGEEAIELEPQQIVQQLKTKEAKHTDDTNSHQ